MLPIWLLYILPVPVLVLESHTGLRGAAGSKSPSCTCGGRGGVDRRRDVSDSYRLSRTGACMHPARRVRVPSAPLSRMHADLRQVPTRPRRS